MSKFKHDLLLRLIKLVDAVLMTIPFALCWYLYYSDRTASPFDQKGNLIVVLLFLVLFIIFGRIYDAFMMSIQQISEIVYAQFLAVAVSDLIIYAAGELKHGTISLIEQGTLVIGVLTQSELYEKTISNMLECKSRGAYLVGLTTYGKYEIEDQVNFIVYVPKVDEHFVGSLAVIPLQLLGYYVSVAKGLDVDKPRNLAKSVTVE